MKTVIDVLQSVQSKGGSAVLVQRHGSYMTGHARGRHASANEMYAANYSRKEPDCMWPLDFAAIQQCHSQARMLADGDIVVAEIIGSHNGRGPHTGQCLSEGFSLAGKPWIPFQCEEALCYPVYDYAAALEALNTVGDACVAEWLNGKRPGLIPGQTPQQFRDRVEGFIQNQLMLNGDGEWNEDEDEDEKKPVIRILTTHFEIVTLVRALAVANQRLGTVSKDWFPTKNGGIIIWYDPDAFDSIPLAAEYAPDYKLVGQPVPWLPHASDEMPDDL